VKDFDRLMTPLCSIIGMTTEEQKKLYQKRKDAKLDPTPKKNTGGLLSLFG